MHPPEMNHDARLPCFHLLPLHHGRLADRSKEAFPCVVSAWSHEQLELPDVGTHFGFVHDGECSLVTAPSGVYSPRPGMYFAAPGRAWVNGPGRGLVITRLGYQGFFHLGGPVEEHGRLRYIDGCSDSLLIAPVLRGDPCLNLLHIPPGTDQTPHTHPSLRVGLVIAGEGRCVTERATLPLRPGQAFLIDADGRHSFHTGASSLTVIAFHPDSDFGPTHDDHPMLNRTLVGGTSAADPALHVLRHRRGQP